MLQALAWKVLLIGGCSGVGKTRVAPVLARRYDALLSQVDDIRMAIQNVTNPQEHLELHFFIDSAGVAKEAIWKTPPEVLCDALIKVGAVVSKALEVVISHHIVSDARIILEGDGILPSMAAQSFISGHGEPSQVRSVFVSEPDKDFFFNEVYGCKPNGGETIERWNEAQMHWLYGQWLTQLMQVEIQNFKKIV